MIDKYTIIVLVFHLFIYGVINQRYDPIRNLISKTKTRKQIYVTHFVSVLFCFSLLLATDFTKPYGGVATYIAAIVLIFTILSYFYQLIAISIEGQIVDNKLTVLRIIEKIAIIANGILLGMSFFTDFSQFMIKVNT